MQMHEVNNAKLSYEDRCISFSTFSSSVTAFTVPSTPMKVFSNNMGKKSEPIITKCKESENWTKVTFKPDLAKFNMTHLEDDVVALMKKRVIDLAGCLGKTVKVELNGQRIPIKSFLDYVNLYLQSASKARLDALPQRDELHKDIEQLCMQQASPGYLAVATRMHFQRGSWSGSSQIPSGVEKALVSQGKSGDWEIDRRLLKIGERIASGSCGDLYRGVYLGQDVAIKVLRSEHLNDALEDEFAQEVAVLREVQHRNVVRFVGACTKAPHLCIVTEYMPGGSLYEYIHKNHIVLNLPQLLQFAIDVCSGMEYLHQNNIIHRDLKTANLLMDNDKVVKVVDFGIARFQNQGGVINHQPYDQKADIFSFAIVLWELVTAKVPYDTMTPLQAALGVRQGMRPDLPDNTHPKFPDAVNLNYVLFQFVMLDGCDL
ncbi:unnamed protein product [Camellia sinensis]